MLLVRPNEWPREKLAEIVQREIGDSEIVELPNLPVNTAIKGPGDKVFHRIAYAPGELVVRKRKKAD